MRHPLCQIAAGEGVPSHHGLVHLKTLRPGDGYFLPVLSCLDGVLSLQPRFYAPTEHDVIRLNPDLDQMWEQQGFVTCRPDTDVFKSPTLSFAVKVGTSKLPASSMAPGMGMDQSENTAQL